MRTFILSVLTLISGVAYADEVMVGGTWAGGFGGLVIQDTNHFNQIVKQTGVYRYGFGHSNLQIGNGVGIAATSSSGFVWKEWSHPSGIGPVIALEGGGFIGANSNLAATNATIYQWLPGAAIGVQYLGSFQAALMFKGGAGLGNYSARDLTPVVDGSLGVGTYVYAGDVQFGAEAVRWGQNFKVSADVLIYVKEFPVSVQYDSFSGGVRAPGQTISVLIKGLSW